MVKLKAYELRKKDEEELKKKLEELKTELSQLRVAKVAGGAPSKLSKIRLFRKNIAKVLTVIHEKRKQQKREEYKDSKHKPLDLRPKQTRKMRQRLTKEERNKVTLRELKKKLNFPQRKFAIAN